MTSSRQESPKRGYTAKEIAGAYGLVWKINALRRKEPPKALPVYGSAVKELRKPQ